MQAQLFRRLAKRAERHRPAIDHREVLAETTGLIPYPTPISSGCFIADSLRSRSLLSGDIFLAENAMKCER